MFFGKSGLVFIVNMIKYDFLLWEIFHLWKIPTILVNAECMTSTLPYM